MKFNISKLAEVIRNTIDLISLSKKQYNKLVHWFRLTYRNGKLYYVVTDAILIYVEEIELLENDNNCVDFCVRFDDNVDALTFLFDPEWHDKTMNLKLDKLQLSIVGTSSTINLELEKINVLDVFVGFHSDIENYCEIKMTIAKFGEMVSNVESFYELLRNNYKASFFISNKNWTEITMVDRDDRTINKIDNIICGLKRPINNPRLKNTYYPINTNMFNIDIKRLDLLRGSVDTEFVTLLISNKLEPMFIYCHNLFNENLEYKMPRMLLMPMRD